jgi:hypothetical protein
MAGVYGEAPNGGYAVAGVASNHTAVLGQTQGYGYGVAAVASSQNSTAALYGRADVNGIYGAYVTAPYTAVFGQSTGSGAAAGYGVAGISVDSAGVCARSSSASSYALVATSTTGLAGLFQGTVRVQGNLVIEGTLSSAAPAAATLSAAGAPAAPADSTPRPMYYMESPQGWIEDFGEGRLLDGRATVPLPPALSQTADTARYHVFLTPHDIETETLAVTARHRDRFEVAEHGKGASTATFSYRIVAARRATPGASADRAPAPQAPPPPPAPRSAELVLPPPPGAPATPGQSTPAGR